MTANEERLMTSKRLSGLDAIEFTDGEFYDRGEVEDALGLVVDDGNWYEAAGVRRLADLIEPEPDRACRNAIDSKDEFICDVCGAFVRDTRIEFSYVRSDDVRMYSTSGNRRVSHCPNCGAKLVER